MTNIHEITIDERLRSHIPPLRTDELKQLEENLLLHGCLSPLITWNGILLDGHNRYEICKRCQIHFEVEEICLHSFEAAIEWIEENQLGRRNLTADQFSYYIGRKYDRLKQSEGGNGTNQYSRSVQEELDQNDQVPQTSKLTSETVAEEHGIGSATVRRAAVFARNVDDIADQIGDQARSDILAGPKGVTRADVAEVAAALPAAKEEGISFSSTEEAFNWVKAKRSEKAQAKKAENDALKASMPKSADGKYGVVVIDPPWDMKKIERDVRPNQVEFDYPTMTEEELSTFDVAGMADDDCHIFCWTTQKFLQPAMRLIEQWGFRYCLLMVWHKSGGFQPIGLPQYNCEFVVYGRKGSPQFCDTKAFPCAFTAPRREHSRKPDEFYDLIRRVTSGERIDVFSREERDGFAQFGNETEKFGAAL